MSVDQAAGIPLCLDTAALGLYAPHGARGGAALRPFWEPDGQAKYKNQPMLIFGGATNVGLYGTSSSRGPVILVLTHILAIQLARLSGFSPIIATASPTNSGHLRSLGATHIIDRNTPLSDLSRSITDITTEPIRLIYAAVSPPDIQQAAYDLLAEDGTLIVVLNITIEDTKRVANKYIADIFGNPFLPDRRELSAELYKRLPALFDSGDLKVWNPSFCMHGR